jgi:hypothetical protein
MLDDEVPLIYLLVRNGQLCATQWEGQGSKSFDKQKFCLAIQAAHVLCKITDTTILYLQEK